MKRPKKPNKLIFAEEEYGYDGCVTIKDIIENFSETARVDFKNITISASYDFGICARYIKEEPFEDFNRRKLEYKKELKEYNEWYKKNKDVIKTERNKKNLVNKKEKLKKELENIDKLLNS